MISFQLQELGLPEDKTGLDVFPLYLVPYDDEHKIGQPCIRFGIELLAEKPPSFAAVVVRDAFLSWLRRKGTMLEALISTRRPLRPQRKVVFVWIVRSCTNMLKIARRSMTVSAPFSCWSICKTR